MATLRPLEHLLLLLIFYIFILSWAHVYIYIYIVYAILDFIHLFGRQRIADVFGVCIKLSIEGDGLIQLEIAGSIQSFWCS